jgi:hypothetical protein
MGRAVMNRMESPQQRDLVAPAMTPVEADLADDHRRDHARPERKIGGRAGKAYRQDSVNHPGQQHRRRPEQENWGEAVDEIPAEVDQPALLEKCGGTNREIVLQRNEHGEKQRQQYAGPQELRQVGRQLIMLS